MENEIVKREESQVVAGFGTADSFELLQRQAKVFSSSELVPKEFQGKIANCVIALEMASRIGASPMAVMQNLYIVHGKPSWSSQFIIGAMTTTGRFSPLRFDISKAEPEKEVSCQITEWENGKKVTKTVKEKICNKVCIAWAIEKGTGERLESPPVSLEMAVKEGWFSKNGSKWQTMPELMLRYRAATFFGRLYAPEVLMGMKTDDEQRDIIGVTPVNGNVPALVADIVSRFTEPATAETVDTSTGEITDAEFPADLETKQAETVTEQPDPEPDKAKTCKHPTSARKWGGPGGLILSCSICGAVLKDDTPKEEVATEPEPCEYWHRTDGHDDACPNNVPPEDMDADWPVK